MTSKVSSHIFFALGLAALLALGAVQGQRLDRIEDAEAFYRWLINAGTQMGIENTLEHDLSVTQDRFQDDEFFTKVATAAEEFLPDYAVDEALTKRAGSLESRLVRAVHLEEDRDVWKLVNRPGFADLEDEFIELARNDRLISVGTQFETGAIYDADTQVAGVGVSSLFFGFRKVAANFVWLQVDKYWHQGQMHRMIPLMRTCVTLDPNFVDAFLLGSWHLAYNVTARLPDTPEPQKEWNEKYQARLGYKETWYYVAMDFLRDGIRKNPRNYKLYFDLGYAIYEVKLGDHANAVKYLRQATHYRHDRWVPRMLNLALMRNGQYEDAIEGWERYIERFPDNPTAQRSLKMNQGLLHEAIYEEAIECARAAEAAAEKAREEGNADYAEQAEADAEELFTLAERKREDAMAIWIPMWEGRFDPDPFAGARIARMKALDLRHQGRYEEALAHLDWARWEVGSMFQEISNLMIEIKQEAGEELKITEKLAIERREEAERYRRGRAAPEEPEIRRLPPCEYLEEAQEA